MTEEEGARWLADMGFSVAPGYMHRWILDLSREETPEISLRVEVDWSGITDQWQAELSIEERRKPSIAITHGAKVSASSPGAALEIMVESVDPELRRRLKTTLGGDPLECRELAGDLALQDGVRWLEEAGFKKRSGGTWTLTERGAIFEDPPRRFWKIVAGVTSVGKGWLASMVFKTKSRDRIGLEVDLSIKDPQAKSTPEGALENLLRRSKETPKIMIFEDALESFEGRLDLRRRS